MEKLFRYILSCSIFLSCVLVAKAQNDGNVSMYWAATTSFNPSTAGSDSAIHVSAFDRMQWVGVDGAPQTFFASADMPFKFRGIRQGVGVNVLSDKAGLFSTTIVSAQYSYSRKLWQGRLAIGIQAGMVNQDFRGSDIYIPDGDAWEPSDDLLPRSDVAGQSLDLALGAFYEKSFGEKEFYVGISATHINEATIDLEEYSYSEQKRTYYFHVGGNIPVNRTLFILQPSMLYKTTAQANQFDFTLRATYANRFWGGISYRHNDAVVLMVGAEIQSLRLGYAYDIGTSALAKASNGSHEILASYLVKLNLDKKKKHPHKSIRIL